MTSDLLDRLGEPCSLVVSHTKYVLFTLYKIIEVLGSREQPEKYDLVVRALRDWLPQMNTAVEP